MGKQDFGKLNIDQTKSNNRQTLDRSWASRNTTRRTSAGPERRLPIASRIWTRARWVGIQQRGRRLHRSLLQRRHLEAGCRFSLPPWAVEQEAWTDLKASNPVSAEQREAAADILSWARAMKFLAGGALIDVINAGGSPEC